MIEETEKLLKHIFDANSKVKEHYLSLSGSDNKIWLIPEKHIKMGLLIFQASSIKGKIAKKILPYIDKMYICLRIIGIKKFKLGLREDIKEIYELLFNEKSLWYTFYFGNMNFSGVVSFKCSR